jgi:hypothetical protein
MKRSALCNYFYTVRAVLLLQCGSTALIWAAEEGHAATVLALIAAGADLNLQNKVRRSAFRPAVVWHIVMKLHWAELLLL